MIEANPSLGQIEHCRADYLAALCEMGFSHDQVRAITDNESDLMPMPEGHGSGLEVKPSQIDGLGTFATRNFRQGEIIAPARFNLKRTPAGRYTNHSPNPNARMVALPDGAIDLVAIRSIQAGDEITVDYRQARAAAARADNFLIESLTCALSGLPNERET